MVTEIFKFLAVSLVLVLTMGSTATVLVVARGAIRSSNVTNWGQWGQWDNCLHGTFVNGMRLKVQRPIQTDQDDNNVSSDEDGLVVYDETALNGVQLFCSGIGSRETKQNISSSQGPWGTWGPFFLCPEDKKAVGFQLRVEPPLGRHGDNTATNNLRLICEGQSAKERVKLEGDGLGWGDWAMPQFCPRYQFICGIRTQVVPDQGTGEDDTALNRIDMDCCNPFTHL